MLLDMLLANRLIWRQSTPVWTKKAKKCKKMGSSGVFVGKGSNPLISLLSRNEVVETVSLPTNARRSKGERL